MLFDLQDDPFDERDLLSGNVSDLAKSKAVVLETAADGLRN